MSALPADQDSPIAVQTMTVSVNTMRIGKKQVTLSMFKQLPEAEIFTDWRKDTLKVQPWGIVRYYWGDYTRKNGFHVVFVQNGALHRCWVIPQPDWNYECYQEEHPLFSRLGRLDRVLLRGKRDHCSSAYKFNAGVAVAVVSTELPKVKATQVTLDMPIRPDSYRQSYQRSGLPATPEETEYDRRLEGYSSVERGIRNDLKGRREARAQKMVVAYLDEAEKVWTVLNAFTDQLKASHERSIDELKALPQLFIAV